MTLEDAARVVACAEDIVAAVDRHYPRGRAGPVDLPHAGRGLWWATHPEWSEGVIALVGAGVVLWTWWWTMGTVVWWR